MEPVIAKATNNLDKTVRARKELLAQLQSLVASNETLLKEEEKLLEGLKAKTARVLETKIEINDMLDEEAAQSAPVEESTTPPAPPSESFDFMPSAPEQEQEYRPQPFLNDIEAPAYSPISSDSDSDVETTKENAIKTVNPGSLDDESEPQTKKAKTEAAPPTGLEGLDPRVAQFLSNLVQGNT